MVKESISQHLHVSCGTALVSPRHEQTLPLGRQGGAEPTPSSTRQHKHLGVFLPALLMAHRKAALLPWDRALSPIPQDHHLTDPAEVLPS